MKTKEGRYLQNRNILILILCILVFSIFCMINVSNRFIAYAAENEENYAIRIAMDENNYLYIGDSGVTGNDTARLTKNSLVPFSSIKSSFISNGGYKNGKIFQDFLYNNVPWGWASEYVPDLGEYISNDGYINLVPQYIDEVHTIKYYYDESNYYSEITGSMGDIISVPNPTKAGYNFTNWVNKSTNVLFNETTIPDITENTESNGVLELVAQWETKQSTIIFNSNGGSIVSNKTNVPYGSVLSGIQTPTRIGYTFNGWFANPLFEGKKYENGIEWDQDIAGVAAPSITLYAKWTPTVYTITFDENGGSQVSDISYTILTPTFYLPRSTKNGYSFAGWKNSYSYVTKITQGTTGNQIFSARWLLEKNAQTWTNVNIIEQLMSLDFSSFSGTNISVNRVYSISSNTEKLILKGTTSKKYTNLRFEIAVRNAPLTIELNNFDFKAQNDMNAIYALDATGATLIKINKTLGLELNGDCELNIECIGTNAIRGGDRTYYNWVSDAANPYKYCSAIVCKNLNIYDFDDNSSLSIYGGNGKNGIRSNLEPQKNEMRLRDGKPGGSAIWASYVYIAMNKLYVYGGNGGDGAMNTIGTGGNGGPGRYAFNVVRKIEILSGSQVYAYGGNGGNGGRSINGNGGTAGSGLDALHEITTIDGSFNTIVNGIDGRPGQ